MPKSGQARVPTPQEQAHLFEVIAQHRHPEKNAAIMQISFKLGLRVQEIALLEVKEVCRLRAGRRGFQKPFELHKVMTLPAAYTKGADALKRSKSVYERKSVTFSTVLFAQVVRQVEALAKAGVAVEPEAFYPPVRRHKGKSRDLPLVDEDLRAALDAYLQIRFASDPNITPTSPLFLNQKGFPYSPNTLQEHMALMLRGWAGIEKASSHSGRRALITNVIHRQKRSIKVAQKIAGHAQPSTTIIYEEPPEEAISDALKNLY